MKKIILFLCFVSVFLFTSKANAFIGIGPDQESGDLTIESHEIVEDNAALAGNTVHIRGDIQDNLFVIGNIIKIDGDVHGTLFAMGNTITISGNIGQDALLAGNMIIFEDSASVSRDLFLASNSVNINAPIGRNLYVGASKLVLNNSIGGFVKASVSDINMGENAQISGDFDYYSEKEINLSSNQITGSVKHSPIEPSQYAPTFYNLFINWVLGLFKFLLVALLITLIAPKWLEKLATIGKTKAAKSLGLGFIIAFITPIAIISLMLTVIGIPLAVIATVLYLVLIYLTKIFVGICIGKAINPRLSPILSVSLGLVIIQILFITPFIAPLAKLIIIIYGLGMFYVALTDKSVKQ